MTITDKVAAYEAGLEWHLAILERAFRDDLRKKLIKEIRKALNEALEEFCDDFEKYDQDHFHAFVAEGGGE